jgi:hypothetical protein
MNRLQASVAFLISQHPNPVSRDRFMASRPAHLLDALISKGYVAVDRAGNHHPTEAGNRFLHDKEAAFNG